MFNKITVLGLVLLGVFGAISDAHAVSPACSVDTAILGKASGTGVLAPTNAFASEMTSGTVNASVIKSLNYAADRNCFNVGSSDLAATGVFDKVQNVLSAYTNNGPTVGQMQLFIGIFGLLPAGGSATTPGGFLLQATQPGSIAIANQCAASAKLAKAFPSKYAFYMLVSPGSSSPLIPNELLTVSDMLGVGVSGPSFADLFGFTPAAGSKLPSYMLNLDSGTGAMLPTVICGHVLVNADVAFP